MMKKVVLAALAASVAFVSSPAMAGVVFGAASYNGSLTLHPSTYDTPTGVAYDGANYYTASGGGSSSPIAQLSKDGTEIARTSPNPGIDFRSVFTDASGSVYARGYNNPTIYKQTSFGEFTSFVTLDGLNNDQESVVLNGKGTGYIGNDYGTLQMWDLNGALTGTATLSGGNAGFIASRGISALGDYALNYSGGTLSAYDMTGKLVDQTILSGADLGDYYGGYGQAYANGYFFVANSENSFTGFAIGTPAGAVPEPASWAMMVGGFGLLGVALRRRARVAVSYA